MRRLTPDEQRLWARVVESVRPLGHGAAPEPEPRPAEAAPVPAAKPRAAPAPPPPARRSGPGTTLDARWDRRLARGAIPPDATLDLHGHDLATAYDLLDRRLEQAVAEGARLLLLVTGRAPRPERPEKRGAIRGAVGDWLAASRHAADIAAVRGAHPRHGGAGALYIVLRRRR
jgi:DNA-nicking Smr family endonuclease